MLPNDRTVATVIITARAVGKREDDTDGKHSDPEEDGGVTIEAILGDEPQPDDEKSSAEGVAHWVSFDEGKNAVHSGLVERA